MKRSPRQVGLVAGTVLALTMALTVAMASTASADPPDLSSDQAINAYLVSIGVDPADAVWQRGLKNYAGPSCPGAGWNCVRANAPIVQIAAPGGTNLFYCTGLDCLIVQVAHNGGQNASACERRVEGPTETLMVCSITQANGPGTNAATISQHIQQVQQRQDPPPQRAREVARITQSNETGSNIARIIQRIGQSSRAKDSSQVQEAHQAATVTQTTAHDLPLVETSTLGDNSSNIRQTQDQLQRASGGSITQSQNTEAGTNETCDQPNAPYEQAKNQCAQVTQHSGVIPGDPTGIPPVPPTLAPGGGDNRSTLNHQITQRQIAEKAGMVTQSQGLLSTGEAGNKEQLSSGVSDSDVFQDTLQVQTANNVTGTLTQTKNAGDPRCCQLQEDNDNNTADIVQTVNQSAFEDGEFSDIALQMANFRGLCVSSGTCNVHQSATINGVTETNDCTNEEGPSECMEVFICASGGDVIEIEQADNCFPGD
jgi:hypothetical protein